MQRLLRELHVPSNLLGLGEKAFLIHKETLPLEDTIVALHGAPRQVPVRAVNALADRFSRYSSR